MTDEEAGLRRAGHRLVLNRDRMDLEDADECHAVDACSVVHLHEELLDDSLRVFGSHQLRSRLVGEATVSVS